MKPCILPWINFSTNPFGRPRTCGYANQNVVKTANVKLKGSNIESEWNNEYFKNIRKEFLNGEWPENCKRCKYVESLGGRSKRQDENYYNYEQYARLIDHTADDGSVDYYPPQIDIRVGTICNLKCIHCGTGASSKWYEDKPILDKYQNTEIYDADNKWIEQDSFIWDNIEENIVHTRRFNFLGGEPFANKQHNRFIERTSKCDHAKNITLSYVSNGSLITEKILDQLTKFDQIIIRLSVDAIGIPGEYFRFPIKWNSFKSKLDMLQRYAKNFKNIDVGVQWTCSNISMFYLTETYEYIRSNYPDLEFILANHVEWPVHMSAQVLPNELKDIIVDKVSNFDFGKHQSKVAFYLNHMMEQDLWSSTGPTFINYLNDLDYVRSVNWKHSFKEMELHNYENFN
jgi:MoaA/NifB/PqqE/SkfB family radical SAM enzyme